jgi:hypothetical protein
MFLRHDMSIQIMYMKPPKLTSLVPWVSKHKSECPFASEQLTVSASSCFKVQASKHFFVQVEATQHRRVGSHCHAALFQCRWVEHTVQYPLLERRGTISATLTELSHWPLELSPMITQGFSTGESVLHQLGRCWLVVLFPSSNDVGSELWGIPRHPEWETRGRQV